MPKSKLFLVAVIVFATIFTFVFSTTAMATTELAANTISVFSTSDTIDNTFTMGSTHRGADRSYSTNKLYVRAIITDTNGNPVDNDVIISLNDYNGNTAMWKVSANGEVHGMTFNGLTPNHIYYFYYTRMGTARDLKVRMIITPVS